MGLSSVYVFIAERTRTSVMPSCYDPVEKVPSVSNEIIRIWGDIYIYVYVCVLSFSNIRNVLLSEISVMSLS